MRQARGKHVGEGTQRGGAQVSAEDPRRRRAGRANEAVLIDDDDPGEVVGDHAVEHHPQPLPLAPRRDQLGAPVRDILGDGYQREGERSGVRRRGDEDDRCGGLDAEREDLYGRRRTGAECDEGPERAAATERADRRHEEGGEREGRGRSDRFQRPALEKALGRHGLHDRAGHHTEPGHLEGVAQLDRRGAYDDLPAPDERGVGRAVEEVGHGDVAQLTGFDSVVDEKAADRAPGRRAEERGQRGHRGRAEPFPAGEPADRPVGIRPYVDRALHGVVGEAWDRPAFDHLRDRARPDDLLERGEDHGPISAFQGFLKSRVAVRRRRRAEVDVERDVRCPEHPQLVDDRSVNLPAPWPYAHGADARLVDVAQEELTGRRAGHDQETLVFQKGLERPEQA